MWTGVIAGALLGFTLSGAQGLGALAGAALGWLVWRSQQQARQIAVLEQAVTALRRGTGLPPEPVLATLPAELAEAELTPPPSVPAAWPGAEPDAAPGTSAASPAHGGMVSPQTVPVAHVAIPAVPREVPAAWLALKHWLFGGNTIVKLGVGILFIGLAFLARYASEQVEVPVAWRLVGIGAVALVLLGLGWRLRLRRPGYAQVLQGGAVAVLYLTLFAAFRFYDLLPTGPVFALMVLVAGLSAALAVLQDAPALAIVGALGGFGAPLLLSTGGGSHVALFSYYAVLDLGIAAVAWHKTWRRLNLVGFVCTFVIATAWGVLQYAPSHYLSSQAFLVFFFLLFNAILMMPARRLAAPSTDPATHDRWVNGSLLFGLPTVTFALQHGLVRELPYGTAFSALALAAFYVALAVKLRQRPALATAFDGSLAVAIVFLSLVVPFALDARSTAGAWALEGAGLVWLGWRQARRTPRAFGYGLLLMAGLSMQWAADRYGAPQAVFNAYLLNALLAAAGSLVASCAVHRGAHAAAKPQPAPAPQGLLAQHPEAWAEPLLIGWALVWALGAASVQIDHFVPADHALAAWLLVGSGIAAGLTGLRLRLAWSLVAWPVMAHAPGLALGVAALAVDWAAPVAQGGWWAWPLALACHAWVLQRAAPAWPLRGQEVAHGLGVLVLAGLGALQGRALTADWGDAGSAWPWLGWLVVPAALLVMLSRPGLSRRWPFSAAAQAYQVAAGILALSLLGWVLLANLASNGAALPLPYLPLLNPLDLGVGLALAAALAGWRSQAAGPLVPASARWPVALLATAGFVWLNAMLVRAFHHFGGVPFHVEAWAHSLAVQAGISLLWTATACVLMRWAAQRARRLPWLVGAALLGAVVLKLLVVDLSGSGTVARIVSFIGVGVLMLVIGYVAPWPAPSEAEAADAPA